MSSARSARSCTSRGFVDPALVSYTTVHAVLGVISRGRPRSQMMCMALPVENFHFRHHNRTRVSLEVRHFMFCRRLEDFACFRRCERLRHDALLLAVAIITCSLKNARALAEASRDGVFLLAHAKRMAFRMLRGSCVRSSFRSSRGRRSTADHRSLRRRPRRVMQ